MGFNKKKMAFLFLLAIFFIILDRFLKILALEFYVTEEISLIGDILKFNLTKNSNIAFSLPFSGIFLIIVTGLIIIALIYFWLILYKKREYRFLPYLTIIIFGAISNLLDRIKYGYVIDYLNMKYFTVFNIADMMIAGGGLALIIYHYHNKYE
ncbi:MAG: signal peptidase II [Patescibacteria group bacterium]|nr:signal peptidase II [Patescibacteria group bacterium]